MMRLGVKSAAVQQSHRHLGALLKASILSIALKPLETMCLSTEPIVMAQKRAALLPRPVVLSERYGTQESV
jgi:hypothetical protein